MRAVLVLVVVAVVGLGLAGCSKCDIPTWGYTSCHGAVPVP